MNESFTCVYESISVAINNESSARDDYESGPLFAYNLDLLKTVECPSCLESMSTYIYLCEAGHSVCQACRPFLKLCPCCKEKMTNRRNFMLESMTEYLFFPCNHEKCPKYVRRKEIVNHYLDCEFKETSCILDDQCKWKGQRIELKKHILENHPGKAWMRDESLDKWRESSNSNVQAIIAHDELFYIYMKRIDVQKDPNLSFTYWGLQYIGPSENAKKFEFTINIYTDANNRSIQYREICHNHKLSMKQIIETGHCISISLKKLRTYLNDYNSVFFKVEVIKLID